MSINRNAGRSIQAPQQASPIEAENNNLSGTDIGEKEKEKEQVDQKSVKKEETNISTGSQTGTVNQETTSGGGSFGDFLSALGTVLDAVSSVSKILNGGSGSKSNSNNSNNTNNQNQSKTSNSTTKVLTNTYNSKKKAAENIAALKGKTDVLSNSGDPFAIFAVEATGILVDLQEFLETRFTKSEAEKYLKDLEVNKFIENLGLLSSNYDSIINISASENLINGEMTATASAGEAMAAQIQKMQDEDAAVIAYNKKASELRSEYLKQQRAAELARLQNNSTEQLTRTTSEKDRAMALLRNSR